MRVYMMNSPFHSVNQNFMQSTYGGGKEQKVSLNSVNNSLL